ncbi:STAS domain-containing protein [Actinokineospora pegani]|uniref:STAS domain-containing protein n=1 Tax=Actinokineospora pegani TaxID=2654637 RepID=UPI0012EAAA1C|nr:STAS domain-containing protein [Actinokineospora pegani]
MDSDAVVVRAGGRVDVQTVGAVRTALRDAEQDRADVLVLDLSEVSFLDSAGLSLLVEQHKRCAEHGVALRLVADSPAVLRPIELTGLDSLLEIHPTVPRAAGA